MLISSSVCAVPACLQGASLTVGEGAISSGNTWQGFSAKGGFSCLTTGPGCRAVGNGAQGFNAQGRGKLVAGEGCVAR
jgi:hypothetical protein